MKIPSFDMTGKVVIVTGATTGIGYATAMSFANYGADVVVTSRKQADCDRVKADIEAKGVRCLALRSDVSKLEDIEELIAKTMDAFGKIDILVNNAGIGGPVCDMLETTEEQWDEVHGINLKGVYMLSKRVAQRMIDAGNGGRIVSVSSVAAINGGGQHSVYGAAKGGVSSLTRYMAAELGPHGITVNAVLPGFIRTEIIKGAIKEMPEVEDILSKSCPMRKIGDPEDIAAMIMFLASDAASFITGTNMVVDGGMGVGPI